MKAVGAAVNAQTVELFRHEIHVLGSLPPAGYRPQLLAVLDDCDWVALALQQVSGRVPDLDNENDFAKATAVVTMQASELTPPPKGLSVSTLTMTARRWARRWDNLEADPGLVPAWARPRLGELRLRVRRLPPRLPQSSLCHFDVRDDNLLITDQGAVIFDWGMARLGPAWTDPLLLAVQKSDPDEAEQLLRAWIPPHEQDTVTDVLVAAAGSQTWNANQPPRPGLANFAAFCAADAARLWAVASRRLQ